MSEPTLQELLGMPFVGTPGAHPDIDPWGFSDELSSELLANVHAQVVRAAGFLVCDSPMEDSVTMLYGLQTHRHSSMQHLKPLYWRYFAFGYERPEKCKEAYDNLTAALSLDAWARSGPGRPKERNCPVLLADLGPRMLGGKERLSPAHLEELALAWNKSAPVLDTRYHVTLDAFFCFYGGNGYVITLPLFPNAIRQKDIQTAAQEQVVKICGPFVHAEPVVTTLWHVGNMQSITPLKQVA